MRTSSCYCDLPQEEAEEKLRALLKTAATEWDFKQKLKDEFGEKSEIKHILWLSFLRSARVILHRTNGKEKLIYGFFSIGG
jgi:hypothetical protein